MDHLHEHQRSTIDRHRQFENQGFPQQRHDPRDGDNDDDDDNNAKHHLAGDGDGDDDDGQEQEQEHHQHHHQGDEGEEGDANVDGEGESGDNGVVDHEHHHHDEQHHAMVDIDDDEGSQLTISYQGEVYLFENVTVRKVHEVLTVLGGQEIQSFLNVPSYLPYPKVQGCVEASVPGQRLNPREREEYIRRYREKRERRVWGKRIIYEVRSSVAVKMNRHKGQFASFKVKDEGAEQKPAAPTPPVETVCQGCGCASGTTPMMRKGPAGPKTLCNACGLMWASKGVLKSAQLRELKSPSTLPQPMPAAQLQNQIHAQQSDFVASSPKISRGTKRKTRAA